MNLFFPNPPKQYPHREKYSSKIPIKGINCYEGVLPKKIPNKKYIRPDCIERKPNPIEKCWYRNERSYQKIQHTQKEQDSHKKSNRNIRDYPHPRKSSKMIQKSRKASKSCAQRNTDRNEEKTSEKRKMFCLF